MKTFWKWINGNKTIICTIIFGFVAQFGAEIGMNPNTISFILWAAGIMGFGSFTHHAAKGKFSTKTD
jgi:hypothetical protein